MKHTLKQTIVFLFGIFQTPMSFALPEKNSDTSWTSCSGFLLLPYPVDLVSAIIEDIRSLVNESKHKPELRMVAFFVGDKLDLFDRLREKKKVEVEVSSQLQKPIDVILRQNGKNQESVVLVSNNFGLHFHRSPLYWMGEVFHALVTASSLAQDSPLVQLAANFRGCIARFQFWSLARVRFPTQDVRLLDSGRLLQEAGSKHTPVSVSQNEINFYLQRLKKPD